MKIKAKYFLLEPKCGAWRQNGGRLGDVTEAGTPVLRGLEVILQILRFEGHFCGDHGASAPPPTSHIRIKQYQWQFTKQGSFCEILVFVILSYALENIEELFEKKLKQRIKII